MSASAAAAGRSYWITWAALLAITVVMLWMDTAPVTRGVLVGILLTAMAVKAGLIAGHFMHLAHEHRGLILTVVVGLFVMGAILYGLIVPDALRIRDMMAGQ
jgi:cytochrome c oxidase subunit IV